MTFPRRLEHFRAVDSTQRIVREWMDDKTPEVAVAVAGYQTAGRGRQGREWVAAPGKALLLSVGFRPRNLAAGHGWRLAAVVALAMRDAAEEVAGLKDGTLLFKWPNDLVADGPRGGLVKVAGVLGESVTTEDRIETAVVGIGINTNWAAADFPWAISPTMSSLRELAGRRPIDNDQLLDAFLARLEPRYLALKRGRFDAAGWSKAQVTTGKRVDVEMPGRLFVGGRGAGVDPETGALLMISEDGARLSMDSGEVIRCRVS
jgi:BirA family transcriptional regulator, biotin operon repressor / biotin---[acetyl-CoA-carboxylase] ligase